MECKYKYKDKVEITVNKYPKVMTYPRDSRKIDIPELDNNEMITVQGEIYIIDRGGTPNNGNKEPSYDVMVPSQNMLYKHVTESKIKPYKEV